MAAGVSTDGWRQLRRQLRKAGDDLTDLKETNRDAAAIVAPTARSRINSKSGQLAATIRFTGTKTAGIVRAGNNGRVPYAGVNAFGWGRRGITANPFLSDAARKTEPRWTRVYQNYLDRIISTLKGR